MSAPTNRLRQLPTPALVLAWALLITARVALFNHGDSLGAYVMLIAFWLASAVLAAQAVAVLVSGKGGWEHRLTLIALAAFFLPPILGKGLASKICFVVFLVAALSLIAIYAKRMFRQGRHAVEQQTLLLYGQLRRYIMWNPRLYALICCVGLLGRSFYRGALAEVSQEPSSWGAYLLIWLPLAVLVGIVITFASPLLRRAGSALKDGARRCVRKGLQAPAFGDIDCQVGDWASDGPAAASEAAEWLEGAEGATGQWIGDRGTEAARTLECIMERVSEQPGEVGCQESAEEWEFENHEPDRPDPPRFPPPGVPGKTPLPAP